MTPLANGAWKMMDQPHAHASYVIVFCFLYPFVTDLLTLPSKKVIIKFSHLKMGAKT
jgi:hypothetical protein